MLEWNFQVCQEPVTEHDEKFPVSLMFLKNARNVDERSLVFCHLQVTVAHSLKARLPVSCEEHWLMHLLLKMASISA